MIVTPDASVILKWVLPGDDEPDTDAALALRDERWLGPLIWLFPNCGSTKWVTRWRGAFPMTRRSCWHLWPISA